MAGVTARDRLTGDFTKTSSYRLTPELDHMFQGIALSLGLN